MDDDSDNDGLLDSVEGTGDDNGNGLPNYVDPDPGADEAVNDADGDGIPDAIEGSVDTDLDGTPDYLDADRSRKLCLTCSMLRNPHALPRNQKPN